MLFLGCLALTAAALAQTPVFKLGFEAPPAVFGLPGDVKTLEVYATITTEDNPSPDGAQGWAIVVEIEGGKFREISLKGVVADTLFDQDGDPSTPLIVAPLDLSEAHFRVARLETSFEEPGVVRAVSAVVPHFTVLRTLLPEGTARVARLKVEAVIPQDGECAALTLRHAETSRPIKTAGIFHPNVTWQGRTVHPALGSFTILLCPPPVFIRCDPNLDGRNDLADAVWILNQLFRGAPASGCPQAADCNGDGRLDIADALYGLAYLLRGGPSPPAPFPSCGRVEGMTTVETCPEPPARCPEN